MIAYPVSYKNTISSVVYLSLVRSSDMGILPHYMCYIRQIEHGYPLSLIMHWMNQELYPHLSYATRFITFFAVSLSTLSDHALIQSAGTVC